MSAEIRLTSRSNRFRLLLNFLPLLSCMLLLSSCAFLDGNAGPKLRFGPRTVVVQASYDEVWQAIQKAMAAYPIQVNNIDSGTIITDTIKSNTIWTAPFKENLKYGIYHYYLKVQVIRGKTSGLPACQIFITKVVTARHDYFSGVEKLPSDGYEEGTILYRIEREILLQRSLKAAFERGDG